MKQGKLFCQTITEMGTVYEDLDFTHYHHHTLFVALLFSNKRIWVCLTSSSTCSFVHMHYIDYINFPVSFFMIILWIFVFDSSRTFAFLLFFLDFSLSLLFQIRYSMCFVFKNFCNTKTENSYTMRHEAFV